jgi:hypothetical protein
VRWIFCLQFILCVQASGEPSTAGAVIVSGVEGLASEVRHEIDPYALNLMYHEVANAVGIEPAPLDMLSEAAGLQEVTAAACCCF